MQTSPISQTGKLSCPSPDALPRLRVFALLTAVLLTSAACSEPPSCFKASIRGVIEIALEMHADPRCVPNTDGGEYSYGHPPWPLE